MTTIQASGTQPLILSSIESSTMIVLHLDPARINKSFTNRASAFLGVCLIPAQIPPVPIATETLSDSLVDQTDDIE